MALSAGTPGTTLATRTKLPPDQYVAVVSTNNITAVAAPAAGNRIAIVNVVIQNLNASTASSVMLKDAASGATTTWTIPTPSEGSGISKDFGVTSPMLWPVDAPLVVDVAVAVDHQVLIQYIVLNANGERV